MLLCSTHCTYNIDFPNSFSLHERHSLLLCFLLLLLLVNGGHLLLLLKGIPFREGLKLYVKTDQQSVYKTFYHTLCKLANVTEVNFTSSKPDQMFSLVVKSDELYLPILEAIDKDEEVASLEKELSYMKGFLVSVNKKLSNERFVNNAPEKVVEMERRKLADAEAKIKALEASLSSLN